MNDVGFAILFLVVVLSVFLFRLMPDSPRRRPSGQAFSGIAYVTDGDGIRVSGQEVRISGIDAPEHDQVAQGRSGRWFPHGKVVKSRLIQKVGGRWVHVDILDHDKFGRVIGVVTCDGVDVGQWLVREGHAIAAYGGRYKSAERQARRERRGMWNHRRNIDPREWRHRSNRKGGA